MDSLESIKQTFFQECDDLLIQAEQGLQALAEGGADDETLHSVFRAVHSVKGGAGAFGLEDLIGFAHVFETVMEDLRSGRRRATPEVAKALLRALDGLADEVNAARQGGKADSAASLAILNEVQSAAEPEPDLVIEDDDFGFVPVRVDVEPAAPAPQGLWHIRLTPTAAMYAKANETGLLLRELARLGTLTASLDASALPDLDQIVAEDAYLTWNLTLSTDADIEAVREVFEFVEDDCHLIVQRDPIDAVAEVAPEPLSFAAPTPAPLAPAAPTTPAARAIDTRAAPNPPASTIRVDTGRVDRLINVVGELVIQQSVLSQQVVESGMARSSSVSLGLDDLEQLTREIQDSVMAIGAQPVKSVFQRMQRLVREVAEATGKQVRLVLDGENTEVDKTVIERLIDPITHLLRNAIDHGLERPDQRVAAGKPAEGVIHLRALHRGGRIIVEIQDDGAGINRPRVRATAIDKGLIPADQILTDEETDSLIFLPGFSTATAVTDISGRGVGMDVVRLAIQDMAGRISISSQPGRGSRFTLSLPVTLAVLDGMVITAGDQTLVVPLTAIIESLSPRIEAIHDLGGQDCMIRIRDSFLPLIDVGMALGFTDTPIPRGQGVAILVEGESIGRAVMLVQAIQGQRQVVIKSLETNYQAVEGVAAATILGDGRVALILDIESLIAPAGSRRQLQQRLAG